MKKAKRNSKATERGFAVIVSLLMMVLLTIIALGFLSLSAVSIRSSSQQMAHAEAEANARLALMIALGELQKEMGPDMRISATASIVDKNPQTAKIDGIAQPRWLASYDSWGNWLNADYAPSGKISMPISATYTEKRSPMFRRWLLSMPAGQETNPDASDSIDAWNDGNSVVMVGNGSLGTLPTERENEITRAHLVKVSDSGAYAWWIDGDNQKARISLARRPRSVSAAKWETSNGDTAEVAVGNLDGFRSIDTDVSISQKLVTFSSLTAANVDSQVARSRFYDLTAHSRGLLASVRSGHLKKDLSLLLELAPADMPAAYRYTAGSAQEPSIRPMSPDLLALNPAISARHFQSWTNMRHFHRMYRQDEAASRGTGTPDSLQWTGNKPYSGIQFPMSRQTGGFTWTGDNAYLRHPVLAKLTYIYSLMTRPVTPGSTTDLRQRLFMVYTPVFTYWNPYNTELRIPDGAFGGLSSTYQVFPMRSRLYVNDRFVTAVDNTTGSDYLESANAHSFLRSGNGGDVVFAPGEFRLFSYATIGNKSGTQDLMPGFNPSAYGGDEIGFGVRNPSERPGIAILFGHSVWGGNINFGNTPGSLCLANYWRPGGTNTHWIPFMYQHDWFNLDQTYTAVAPDPNPANNPRVSTLVNGTPAQGPEHILRWIFDGRPTPVAYTQLVLKGLSQFDHESISWKKDWISRSWLHSPPAYFASATFISENRTIAQTQRIDCPYVMNFGAMSMADMGKVVFHSGPRSFFGSGEEPFEVVSSIPVMELPTAPAGSIASYSTMRINPGWANPLSMNSSLRVQSSGTGEISQATLYFAYGKTHVYQSGITGPGIGNSFVHPMIPKTSIYHYFNNSVSMDPVDRNQPFNIGNGGLGNDHKVFSDYWDHVFLLNDALWDDYFVSSLSDQTRPSEPTAESLAQNIDRLVSLQSIPNSRYSYESGNRPASQVKSELLAADGYLKAARHLVVEGMFNVNSTSVAAWFSLFAGIRERSVTYRDTAGVLRPVAIPDGKRIAISRFGTETSDQETQDPKYGVTMPDGSNGWSGVRFLDDDQLLKLSEECVKQVKMRGPFLSFSEFVNRRLSDDDLGLMGALQAAIDHDDASPEPGSINGRFKDQPDYLMTASDLGDHAFPNPAAVEGSRFAGIPGYVIQSDLLRPIANTLSVRDDTFRIRAYGESLDPNGKVMARAWCEAIVQRYPDYADGSNEPTVAARIMSANGTFSDNPELSVMNRKLGRKIRIESFRWLKPSEI